MYNLYRTTNIINKKYYIGVSNGNNKWYKGSGTALKRAIKKYGTENFTTEIIETVNSEQAAFDREAEIVTEELVNDRNCYNMKVGGKGGVGQQKTAIHKQRISDSVKQANANKKQYTAGRKPAVSFSETYRIWQLMGSTKGAAHFNISVSAFKSRVATAKKKLK